MQRYHSKEVVLHEFSSIECYGYMDFFIFFIDHEEDYAITRKLLKPGDPDHLFVGYLVLTDLCLSVHGHPIFA